MQIPTDHEIDLSVAAMLRFGVTSAAIVAAAGGLLYLRHPNLPVPDYSHFHALANHFKPFLELRRGPFISSRDKSFNSVWFY